MKINNITAQDYHTQGTSLILRLTDTSMEEITGMDAALLKVETDDGDPVENLIGYRLVRVAYEVTDGTFTAVLELGVEDTMGNALKAVAAQLKEIDATQKEVAGPIAAAVCAFAATATEISDPLALEMASLFPTWEAALAAGMELPSGRIITKDGQPYRVVDKVTPKENEAPGMDGMLAVYRPIDEGHSGTLDDPIPWVYGMDCLAGMYYSHNGDIYRVEPGGNMIPCVWAPGSEGVWQWKKITNE